jgi:type I restriction enzyme S subunit
MNPLPNGWRSRSLVDLTGESGLMADGDWIESKDQDPQGRVRLIQLADIGDGYFLDRSSRFLTREKAEELGCTFLVPGDVLIARMPEPLGRACIFPGLDQDAVTAVDICIWRPGADAADPDWVKHIVNSPPVRDQIVMLAGGTTRQRISGGNLKRLQVPTPPKPEQRRIVAKLDSLFRLSKKAREELGRIPRLVERYKEAILRAAFNGDLTSEWRSRHSKKDSGVSRFSSGAVDARVSALSEIPEEWNWTSMGSVASITGGLTKNSRRDSLPLKVRYLRVANVYANELRLADVSTIGCTAAELGKTKLIPGDLLIVEGNGSLEQIGRVAIWNGELIECSHQNHLIRARPGQSVLSQFVLHWLLSPGGRSAIEEVASSSSGLHTLSVSKVSGLPIPLCCLEEQQEIIRQLEIALERIDVFASEAAQAADLLDRLDQATLAKASRGELVPQEN